MCLVVCLDKFRHISVDQLGVICGDPHMCICLVQSILSGIPTIACGCYKVLTLFLVVNHAKTYE